MSFISPEFAVLFMFLLVALALTQATTIRKLIVFAVSCLFYAYWDWRLLALLGVVTVLDYYLSHLIVLTDVPKQRRFWLAISVIANLGFLGFFKYFNFFIDTLNPLFAPLNWHVGTLSIILPIGISFYIFETLSYVIDVYRGAAKPAQSLLDYAIFITFFPRLVAGPIMRAQQFLPQLERGIIIQSETSITGTQLFLRGMIKKMVIADNLAIMVDQVYAAPDIYSSPTVLLGILAYSIQILLDFSGYTDMALGLALILGFKLPENFRLPYTSQSITEFWQRWHISLSTWLRDYLYIPLGGNRNGAVRSYINLMLTMLLGGLWHGASWNFVLWGGLHGIFLISERLLLGKRPDPSNWESPKAWLRATFTFTLVTIAWILFRSPSLDTTFIIFRKLLWLTPQGIQWLYSPALYAVPLIYLGGLFWRRWEPILPKLSLSRSYSFAVLAFEVLLIYFLSPIHVSPFIYFQF